MKIKASNGEKGFELAKGSGKDATKQIEFVLCSKTRSVCRQYRFSERFEIAGFLLDFL